MHRRAFVSAAAIGVLTGARGARAQVTMTEPLPHVGALGPTPWNETLAESFRQGLGDHGYVEGRHVVLDVRDADGKPDRMAPLATELLRLNDRVILVRGPAALAAVKKATGTVAIVAVDLETDPVAMGFVRTLAQPSGNVTGVFLDLPELGGKQLQLLQEIIRPLTRVAILGDPVLNAPQFQGAESAARALGMQPQRLEVRTKNDIEAAMDVARRSQAGAMVLLSSPLVFYYRRELGALASKRRLPAVSMFTEYAEAGGLMAYGPSLRECFRRAGGFVGRILKGAKPGDLPVERPEKFELVINRTTARTLSLTVPQALITRADRIVD